MSDEYAALLMTHYSSLPYQKWLGREDSNLRMPASKAGALPLGDAPVSEVQVKRAQEGNAARV